MLHRLTAIVLVTLFAVPSLAMAQDRPIAKSIAAAAAREAQRPAARGETPYLIASLALIGGGATLAIIGMTSETGVKCGVTTDSFSCGTTMNKGLLFTGIGVAGLGAYLFMRGESRRNMPSITARPGTLAVGYTVKF